MSFVLFIVFRVCTLSTEYLFKLQVQSNSWHIILIMILHIADMVTPQSRILW